MKTWRALVAFLRPYAGRFGLSLVLGILGSVLDGTTFLLLIPFLRAVFGDSALPSTGGSKAEQALTWALGPLLQGSSRERAFIVVVALILVAVMVKNLFIYLSRLEGMRVQEYLDRKSTRLNSSHIQKSRMPSSA